MSRIKISRKKLLQEPDEFLSLSQRAWLWLHQNRDRAAMIGGGIAALVLIAIGVKAAVDRSHQKRTASVAAAVARYTQSGDAVPSAELRHELAGLAERYAGSPAGSVARFFQAGALAAAGETDQARQLYGKLAAGTDEIALSSRLSLAYLEASRGSADAALSAFQELLKVEGQAVPRAQILAEIAALHEKQGRAADARRVYEELLAKHPDGPWAAAAKARLRLLGGPGAPAA